MKIKLLRARRQEFWGAHAPSRADFGALAEIFFQLISTAAGKVRDREGAIASTRGACAPQINR
jgi:predicted HAD superfamily Cof-like phosphohydrolase